MKAWAVVRPKAPLECVEISDPAPTGTEVVIAVTHCGVCHSDLHFWEGEYNLGAGQILRIADRGAKLPRAMGHEMVGRVLRHGPEAEGVSIGDLRIVYPWLGCGVCERCLAGESNLCARPASFGSARDGGYAEQVLVPHPRYLVDPGGIDPALAATYACSGLTVYSAIRKVMPLRPDQPIVLIGAGGLGLAAISMLLALGHECIISVDIAKDKREAALAMGATAVIDPAGPGAAEMVREAAQGLILAVLDFVNSSGTAQFGLDLLAKGGKLVLLGYAGGEITLPLGAMMFGRRNILTSGTGSLQDLHDVVALARDRGLAPIPITRMPPDQANEALRRLHDGEVTGRIVLERHLF